ncbi:MAG: GNVR domain-containing protein [Saprospiraceae bacterium]|nr:GNVR domain-containing protein [Saprospiraceae bacterium]
MNDSIKQIGKYAYCVYRYKYIFLAVSLLVMTAVGVYTHFLPKLYKAETTVFIEKNVIDELVEGIAITPSLSNRIKQLKLVMLSRDLVTRTLEDIEADIFVKSEEKQQAYITNLIDRINVKIGRDNYFRVSLVDQDPVFAQQFINKLVGKYVEQSISSTRDETYGANRFLEEQLLIFKDKLINAQDKIINFRNQQGILFSTDETGTINELRKLMSEIEEISMVEESLKAKKRELSYQLSKTQPTTSTISEGETTNRLVSMQRRLENLRLRYTENYPEVMQLKQEIAELQKRLEDPNQVEAATQTTRMTSANPIYQKLQEQLIDIEAELSSLATKKMKLERAVAKREQELKDVPEAKKELNILIQDRDSIKKVYESLLARMGQSEVSKQMEIGNKTATFRVIDPALLPTKPISPDMLKMLLAAIGGGFACGFGLVFLLDTLDSRVRDIDFVEGLGVSVLAAVPRIASTQTLRRRRVTDLLLLVFTGLYILGFAGIYTYAWL